MVDVEIVTAYRKSLRSGEIQFQRQLIGGASVLLRRKRSQERGQKQTQVCEWPFRHSIKRMKVRQHLAFF